MSAFLHKRPLYLRSASVYFLRFYNAYVRIRVDVASWLKEAAINNSTYIYGLRCPVTEQIRYVGKSDSPRLRLSSHCTTTEIVNKRQHEWIQWLDQQKLRPELVILEQVPNDREKWTEAEKRWIDTLKKLGYDLTNRDNRHGVGGHTARFYVKVTERVEGLEGYETTKEVAERLGVNTSRIRQFALAGRLPGAMKAGRDWVIPKGTTPTPPEKNTKKFPETIDKL